MYLVTISWDGGIRCEYRFSRFEDAVNGYNEWLKHFRKDQVEIWHIIEI